MSEQADRFISDELKRYIGKEVQVALQGIFSPEVTVLEVRAGWVHVSSEHDADPVWIRIASINQVSLPR